MDAAKRASLNRPSPRYVIVFTFLLITAAYIYLWGHHFVWGTIVAFLGCCTCAVMMVEILETYLYSQALQKAISSVESGNITPGDYAYKNAEAVINNDESQGWFKYDHNMKEIYNVTPQERKHVLLALEVFSLPNMRDSILSFDYLVIFKKGHYVMMMDLKNPEPTGDSLVMRLDLMLRYLKENNIISAFIGFIVGMFIHLFVIVLSEFFVYEFFM